MAMNPEQLRRAAAVREIRGSGQPDNVDRQRAERDRHFVHEHLAKALAGLMPRPKVKA